MVLPARAAGPSEDALNEGNNNTGPQYTITMKDLDSRIVHVECRFHPSRNTINMSSKNAGQVKDGWAKFVRDLKAIDLQGEAIPVKYLGNARWQIQGNVDQPLTLTYDLILEHEKEKWPFGADEAAYVKDDCAFFVSKALFVTDQGFKDAIVHFDVPDGWRVSTPWRRVDGRPNTFRMRDFTEMTGVCLLIGSHVERVFRTGPFEITIAMGHDLAEAYPLMEDIIQRGAKIFMEWFGSAPNLRFVIIINRDEFDGGGAFERSISMFVKDAPTAANADGWGDMTLHEILHMWNGRSISAAGQDEWFKEGFTTYLTLLCLKRIGVLDEQGFFDSLAKNHQRYLNSLGNESIRRAGYQKRKHYDLVYSGGCMAAAVMDADIRTATNNQKGLPQLMRSLYEEFGQADTKFKFEDIVRVSSEFLGPDAAKFFQKYIIEKSELPVADALGRCGLDVITETKDDTPTVNIRKSPDMSPAQQARLTALLNAAG